MSQCFSYLHISVRESEYHQHASHCLPFTQHLLTGFIAFLENKITLVQIMHTQLQFSSV